MGYKINKLTDCQTLIVHHNLLSIDSYNRYERALKMVAENCFASF